MIAKCRYVLKAAVLVVGAAAVLFMAGCGKSSEIETPASGRGGYSVVDATKTRLDFEHKPQRIVSLGLSADEVLLDSARREAEEELGIAGVPFAEHGQFYFEDENCRVWGGLFSCVSHGPFALQEEEVSEVSWMTPEEITARCDEFTPDSLKALALWMTRNAKNESTKSEKEEEAE